MSSSVSKVAALTLCLAFLASGCLRGTAPAEAAFGITSFEGLVSNPDGSSATRAGSHPFEATTTFRLNIDPVLQYLPDEQPKDITAQLPAGFIANPQAVAECPAERFAPDEGQPGCSGSTQVGTVRLLSAFGIGNYLPSPYGALINIEPGPGQPALFGFSVNGTPVYLVPRIRTGGDYGFDAVSVDTSQYLWVAGVEVTLWGDPSSPAHDNQRLCGGAPSGSTLSSCSLDVPPQAFLTNPSNCSAGPLSTAIQMNSWQHPGTFASAHFETDTNGNPMVPTDCAAVPFDPHFDSAAGSSEADTPSGMSFSISMLTGGLKSPLGLAQAPVKQVTLELPLGMSVNPAAASGLSGCTAEQIGLLSPGAAPTFTSTPARCSDQSKIGTVEIATPLLDDPLPGSLYVAMPDDPEAAGIENPFGTLLSLYLVVDDQDTGIVLKLPGRVEADPGTGRLTASFDHNPQIPFDTLRVSLKGGERAPLVTPPACGTYEMRSAFSPWSAADPEHPTANETVTRTATIDINSGPDQGPCPAGSKFDPEFEAGTVTPIAGSFSPLVVKASRPDGAQPIAGVRANLPEGLLGKLAGVPTCSAAALNQAEVKTGAQELAGSSCSPASRLGSVRVRVGAGSMPVAVDGTVYLAGPYRGAPLSLAVVTPAVAGPFDLGTVVTRAAVNLDPVTTRIDVTSDPIPQILEGIPLKLRSVEALTDRPDFTVNPTDCDPMSVDGILSGVSSSRAVSDRFQVGACAALSFKPKLTLALKGKVHRRAHPSLRATLVARPGEANIARAQVKLPGAAFLDNGHITGICSRVQFAASNCPKGSVYGRASVASPLLDYKLNGPVVLRSNPAHLLPDLVVAFRGPDRQPITVELAGRTDSVKGALRNTFEAVPDVPVRRFSLTLFGGKKGLIEMSGGFCQRPRATVKLDGQNGKIADSKPRVKSSGCGSGRQR